MDEDSPDFPAFPGPSDIIPEAIVKKPRRHHTYTIATSENLGNRSDNTKQKKPRLFILQHKFDD